MTVDTQKLRELIAAVHEASDIHGEQAWYEPPGTLYIDPAGVGKADFDYIAYLSPDRVSALIDEIDMLRDIEARNASLDKECGRLERENDRLRAELQARQWISASDEMPKENDLVLACHVDGAIEVVFGFLLHETGQDGSYTHWQHLPPTPPQGEKE